MTASARGPQSLRGHVRKLVSELRQQMRLDHLCQPDRPRHRHANAVIGLVLVQRSVDSPLAAENRQEHLLALLVDLEKCVGLAAHGTVAEQCPDNDVVLHFRQTSHGITQSYGANRIAPRRWAPPLLADTRPTFLPTHPRC